MTLDDLLNEFARRVAAGPRTIEIAGRPRRVIADGPLAYVIYALCEPSTGAVRYVGQTRSPEERYLQHLRAPSIAVNAWILGLRAEGKVPVMVELQRVPAQLAITIEFSWIAQLRLSGQADLNAILPGEEAIIWGLDP